MVEVMFEEIQYFDLNYRLKSRSIVILLYIVSKPITVE